MEQSTWLPWTACSFCIIICTLAYMRYRGSTLPLPPGPPPLLLVGNVKNMPTSHDWLLFTEWSKKYGDVVYVHVFGYPLIILNSIEAAKDLLDSRGSIYSCRPRFPMISELMGWDWAVQFMPYAPRFKKFRRAVQASLHPQVVTNQRPAIQTCANDITNAIRSEPNAFLDHISHGVGSLMISVIYGVEDTELRNQYIGTANRAIEGLIEAGNVGTFLVDVIPALKYVPEWFPGASFKKKARKWRRLAQDMIEIPYGHAHQSWLAGKASSSIVHTMLSQSTGKVDHDLIKGTAGVIYLGGADTQLSLLFSFVLLMLLHPDIQKRAQAEIDSVVGKGCCPTFEDRPSLPYLECIYLETIRWYPTVPLGVPHRLMKTDYYKGFVIPQGSSILVNQWAIFRNEDIYEDPSKFNPDRFAYQADPTRAVLDPRTVAFGNCPGRVFAEDATWMIMSSILSQFEITYARDSFGEPIVPA